MANSKLSTLTASKQEIRLHIFSHSIVESVPITTLRKLLDENNIKYQLINDNTLELLKEFFQQKQTRHMIIIDNTQGIQKDMPGKSNFVEVYSYPKKHFSKKYQCLPNAGKVLNTYHSMIANRKDSSSRVKLRSVCQSPDSKYMPIYSQIFVHRVKGDAPDLYTKLTKYLLELPSVIQFDVWRQLKSDKPSKKNKSFVITYVEESQQLIKNAYDNRISQHFDIGVVGVRPTKQLLRKNVAIATDNAITLLQFITERGFNVSSIKPKLIRHMNFSNSSFVSSQQSNRSSQHLSPLSVIPQKRQTLLQMSKVQDQSKSNLSSMKEDEKERKPQPSRWLRDKEQLQLVQGLPPSQDINHSNAIQRVDLTSDNVHDSQKLLQDSVQENQTVSSNNNQSNGSFLKESKREIIFNSAKLNQSHSKKLQEGMYTDQFSLEGNLKSPNKDKDKDINKYNQKFNNLNPLMDLALKEYLLQKKITSKVKSWTIINQNGQFITQESNMSEKQTLQHIPQLGKIKHKVYKLNLSKSIQKKGSVCQDKSFKDSEESYSKPPKIVVSPPIISQHKEQTVLFETLQNREDKSSAQPQSKSAQQPIIENSLSSNQKNISLTSDQNLSSTIQNNPSRQGNPRPNYIPSDIIHQVSQEYYRSNRQSQKTYTMSQTINQQKILDTQDKKDDIHYQPKHERKRFNSLISGNVSISFSALGCESKHHERIRSINITDPFIEDKPSLKLISQQNPNQNSINAPKRHIKPISSNNTNSSNNYEPDNHLEKMEERVLKDLKTSTSNKQTINPILSNHLEDAIAKNRPTQSVEQNGFKKKKSVLKLYDEKNTPQVAVFKTLECIDSQTEKQQTQSKKSKLMQKQEQTRRYQTQQQIQIATQQPISDNKPATNRISQVNKTIKQQTLQQPQPVNKQQTRRYSIVSSKSIREEDSNQNGYKPSRVLRKDQVDLSNYIRTVDEKGRVVYKSKDPIIVKVEDSPNIIRLERDTQNDKQKDNNQYRQKKGQHTQNQKRHSGQLELHARGSLVTSPIKGITPSYPSQNQAENILHNNYRSRQVEKAKNIRPDQIQIRMTSSTVLANQPIRQIIVHQVVTQSPNIKVRQIYSPNHRRFTRKDQDQPTLDSNKEKTSTIKQSLLPLRVQLYRS